MFLADWAAANDRKSDTGGNKSEVVWRLGIYALIGLFFSVFTVLQSIFVYVYCAMRSARILHNEMLDNILKVPQTFFDVTPLGRILNRFSKDQNVGMFFMTTLSYSAIVDESLPRTFHGYFRTFFQVMAVLAVNSIGSPFFILFAIPLGFLYYNYQKYYLTTSRELKRLVFPLYL